MKAVELVFTREYARLVAQLTRSLGLASLATAEDAVQSALVKAMRLWPVHGEPANPSGWLFDVARNAAIDALRRDGRQVELSDEWAAPRLNSGFANEISDDEMALLFAVCHPALPVQSQLVLALKVLCGFGAREIAAGLLTTENAVAQRLARARALIADQRLRFEVPPPEALPARRAAVLAALHLMFNEGYQSASADEFHKPAVCAEAIRLSRAVALHPTSTHPDAHALAATLLFHAARMPSRLGADGHIILLADQARSTWDSAQIGLGLAHLQAAQSATALSTYHLQAGIAAAHSTAPSYAQTDWTLIVRYYQQLSLIDPQPTTRLGHAIAIAQLHGAAADRKSVV